MSGKVRSPPRAAARGAPLTMNRYSPVWDGIVDSSVWEEPDHVFRVFIAMLALKDLDDIVRPFDAYKFSRRIHMELPLVLDALKILAAPDARRPNQEYEGRRIEAIEEGWLVLNGAKYRRMLQREMKLARDRKASAAYREREKRKYGPSLRERQATNPDALHDAPTPAPPNGPVNYSTPYQP